MVVYDITNRGSLMECSKWLTGEFNFTALARRLIPLARVTAVKTVNSSAHSVLGVLVGNKNEYRHGVVDTMTEVSVQEGQQAAGELGLAYFESSAVANDCACFSKLLFVTYDLFLGNAYRRR